jgi:alcohol oxidase
MKYIHPSTGGRSDAANAFIWPILSSTPNLHLRLETRVSRVLIDSNGRATGVECISSSSLASDAVSDSFDTRRAAVHNTITIMARKTVVLSAGTLSTPLILERSGVGNPSVISAAGVSPVLNLPGVGENFQDHHGQIMPYYLDDSVFSPTDHFLVNEAVHMANDKEWQEKGTGPYATNYIDIGIKYRPTEKDVEKMGRDFQKVWKEYFAQRLDRPIFVFAGGPT